MKKIISGKVRDVKLSDMPAPFSENSAQYDKRTVLVKKLKMLPYEFVVRGYMFGSMWQEYRTFCGQKVKTCPKACGTCHNLFCEKQ